MNIVVLDGHTLNPDDLSWSNLEAYGVLKVYPRTAPEDVVSRSLDADILLINKIKVGSDIIDQLPKLKYIGLLATGFDNVDVVYANMKGIVVTNVPAYGTISVAQHTFALLMEMTNRVGIHNRSVHDLEWERNKDFSYFKKPLMELSGKTMGILGYGSIGKAVANLALAFDMEVIVHSTHTRSVLHGSWVELDDLFEKSDVLSIHASLSKENTGLINAEVLSKMKSTALLVNTSRGAIINEQDLADALNNNVIAGAACDVLSTEPPPNTHPLLNAKNCIITPHISWVTREARLRLMNTVVENVKLFLDNTPSNVINHL